MHACVCECIVCVCLCAATPLPPLVYQAQWCGGEREVVMDVTLRPNGLLPVDYSAAIFCGASRLKQLLSNGRGVGIWRKLLLFFSLQSAFRNLPPKHKLQERNAVLPTTELESVRGSKACTTTWLITSF